MKGSIRFNDAVNAEVTTDGTDITKVVNVATGEEYGGGGGVSTANVTVIYDGEVENIPCFWPHFLDEPDYNGVLITDTFITPGTYECVVGPAGLWIDPDIPPGQWSITGDAETIEEITIAIHGDCTITFYAE